MTDYTNEQIEEARAIVQAADQKARDEAEAKRAAYIAPVTNLVNGDAYSAVYTALCSMRETYESDGRFSLHVNALAEIMPRLAVEIGVAMTPPTAEEPEASIDSEPESPG
ncbi:hypothetical protein AV944_06745 [Sphingomonas sp. LK11]|jgi:hypothetical protein|uniref:hypothetical protein n=1 Tax=Sphingomonas sp. LK11 TaxID=1390395 RepID=UPI0009727998|nr:hypothetical protein [Sphingomonas sp. LK11]APX65594.1 hypothetical protein AV944_06745 [Sphingomonas sp. LK11]